MAPGAITFEVKNATADRGTFFLAVLPPGTKVGQAPITFLPFLTGKRLLTTQAFRDLFRSEVIRTSEGIGVKDITLLFTDVKGSTALYDRIGDLNAFALVQQHFERLQDIAARFRGAISECHSAGRTPNRSAKRSRNCAVSAISGIRISTCLFCRIASATASK